MTRRRRGIRRHYNIVADWHSGTELPRIIIDRITRNGLPRRRVYHPTPASYARLLTWVKRVNSGRAGRP